MLIYEEKKITQARKQGKSTSSNYKIAKSEVELSQCTAKDLLLQYIHSLRFDNPLYKWKTTKKTEYIPAKIKKEKKNTQNS